MSALIDELIASVHDLRAALASVRTSITRVERLAPSDTRRNQLGRLRNTEAELEDALRDCQREIHRTRGAA